MKRTHNLQINSRTYWNHIYTTPAREKEYWSRTFRFFTALNYIEDGDRFIDLGCGVGIPCRMVLEKKKGCEAWGVDISDQVIDKNKTDEPRGQWRQGQIGALYFLPKGYFNIAFCGEVIEHLDIPQEAFDEAYRILKKGGKFIITTPRENRIQSPEHVWEYTQDDVRQMYANAGFHNVEFVDLPDMEHLTVFFAVGTK